MALTSTDIRLYRSLYTSASENEVAGGDIGASEVDSENLNNVFLAGVFRDDEGSDEIIYQKVFVKNINPDSYGFYHVGIFIHQASHPDQIGIALEHDSFDAIVKNGDDYTSRCDSAPTTGSGYTFEYPDGIGNALDAGNLLAQQYQGIWIRRVLEAGLDDGGEASALIVLGITGTTVL